MRQGNLGKGRGEKGEKSGVRKLGEYLEERMFLNMEDDKEL